MPIARKPERKRSDNEEQAASAFIEGADTKRQASSSERSGQGRKTPVMVRFDVALLELVDQAARKRGVSRSAWIQFTLSRALEAGEG